MKENLQISINPSYKCNFHCGFCYLQGLFSEEILDPEKLNITLQILSHKYNITFVDLYGGEITNLHDSLVEKYLEIIKKYVPTISIITNGSRFPEYFKRKDIDLAVSWDYKYRPYSYQVMRNLEEFRKENPNKKISILLTSPKLYEENPEFLRLVDKNCDVFELKPCMKTRENDQDLDFKAYLDTCIRWMNYDLASKFLNRDYILYQAFPKKEKHLFINPKGDLIDVSYQDNFESFKSIKDCKASNLKCLTCKFFNKCFNEHPGYYIDDGYDCLGQRKFLEFITTLQDKYRNFKTIDDFEDIRKLSYDYNDFVDNQSLIYENTPEETLTKFLKYFENPDEPISYPSKSYFVAYVYAYLISMVTGIRIPLILLRKDLLPNDPVTDQFAAFKFYLKYNDKIPHLIDFDSGMQKITKGIFEKEFPT